MGNFKDEDYLLEEKWYNRFQKKLGRRNRWAMVLLLFAVIFSAFLATFISDEAAKIAPLKAEVAQLKQERNSQVEEIQQTASEGQTQKFENYQAELTKGWNVEEDTYQVTIDKQKLLMNQQNIFVSDNAHLLREKTKQKVYQMNEEFAKFKDGQQLMIVTVDALPKGTSIETFAFDIFNKLGIGQADKNNGVLYVMAVKDRKTRIEVGYGLEATLTNQKAADILADEETVEAFQDEEYDAGVNRILDQLHAQIGSLTPTQDKQISQAEASLGSAKMGIGLAVGMILFSLLPSLLFWRMTSKLRRRFRHLSKEEVTDLYRSTPNNIFSAAGLSKSIRISQFMARHPNSERCGANILVGNMLYNVNGVLVTNDYETYSSSSSNDSFGGGSSGGGGASGGW